MNSRPGKLHLLRSPEQCVKLFATDAAIAVCIGNFDGFHRGHQALFSELARVPEAKRVMLTFAPHPRRVLKCIPRRQALLDPAYQLLTPLRERVALAAQYGFDALYQIRFNSKFAALTPDDFLSRYLFDALNPKLVVVGADWTFGRNRSGNIQLLEDAATKCGATVIACALLSDEGGRVSSSRVRHTLEDGDVKLAEQLLARPFAFHGRVVRGRSRGRQLGFPTANLFAPMQFLPRPGVYATQLIFNDGLCRPSVTNIGYRPTFSESTPSVEAHVLDYSGPDFYGQRVGLEFVERLRNEQHFPSAEALKAQITLDIEQARGIFKR